MVTEEGVVIQIDGQSAWVKATKTAACESCEAQSSCHVMGGGKEMKVNALNEAGAKVDDRVIISFETSSLLKASFLLYVAPILALILGAFAGQAISPHMQWDPSTGSIVVAFLFFLIMVMVVKTRGNKIAERREYKPRIIRIVGRGAVPIVED